MSFYALSINSLLKRLIFKYENYIFIYSPSSPSKTIRKPLGQYQKWQFCHHLFTLNPFQACLSFFILLNIKIDFEECGYVGKLMIPIDFYYMYKIIWMSMVTVSCLVNHILQNLLFCVQQKEETQTGLEQLKGE